MGDSTSMIDLMTLNLVGDGEFHPCLPVQTPFPQPPAEPSDKAQIYSDHKLCIFTSFGVRAHFQTFFLLFNPLVFS